MAGSVHAGQGKDKAEIPFGVITALITPNPALLRFSSSRHGTDFYTEGTMRALLATEFTALLDRADVTQAAFARLTGVTPRQVNNWCRARAAVPLETSVLAALLQETSLEAIRILVEGAPLARDPRPPAHRRLSGRLARQAPPRPRL
jgi:hypothetical protein